MGGCGLVCAQGGRGAPAPAPARRQCADGLRRLSCSCAPQRPSRAPPITSPTCAWPGRGWRVRKPPRRSCRAARCQGAAQTQLRGCLQASCAPGKRRGRQGGQGGQRSLARSQRSSRPRGGRSAALGSAAHHAHTRGQGRRERSKRKKETQGGDSTRWGLTMKSASGEPGTGWWSYIHLAVRGVDMRIDSVRPPVFRPKVVPRS